MTRSRLGRSGVIFAAVVVSSVAAMGCGGDDKSAPPTTSGTSGSSTTAGPAGAAGMVTIKSFKFAPEPAQAKVGDTITITNMDGTDHTATADDGSFDTGKFQGTKTFTVTKSGTIKYHCDIHTYMTGTIQVTG
jgi:plastocyanin